MNCKCCHCLSVTFSKKNLKIIILTILVLFLVFLAYQIFSGNLNKNNKEAYSTLFVGFGAIVAAIIAFLAVEKQVSEQVNQANIDRKRRGIEYKIQVNKERLEGREHRCAVIKAIISDITALTARLKNIGLDDASQIASSIQSVYRLGGEYEIIRIEQNYFVIFDSLIKEITYLPLDIVSDVFSWYTEGKGYVETIMIAKKNINNHKVVIDQEAKFIANETDKLILKGEKIKVSLLEKLLAEEAVCRNIFQNIYKFEEVLTD